jgi:hypothetical protein
MPAIRIRPLPDGGRGPLGGPFTVESVTVESVTVETVVAGDPFDEGESLEEVAATVIDFGRWISRGMTYYDNKGGFEDSSLFKSFTAECFDELSRDSPEAAACLTGLTVICSDLPESLRGDPTWLLHRAILASLPGVRFVD